MNKFKKIIVCVVVSLMIMSSIMPAYASSGNQLPHMTAIPTEQANFLNIVTHEKAMPILPSSYLKAESSTLKNSTRAAWINSTKDILEKAYGQKIRSVEEDTNVIRFLYETTDVVIPDQVLDADDLSCTKPQLLMTEYAKPESQLAMQGLASTNSISTKINYYYDWSNGYYKMSSGVAKTLSEAYNVSMLIAAGVLSNLQAVVLTVATISGDSVMSSMPVSGETYVKYYYLNKISYGLSGTAWLPWVTVGSRRSFSRKTSVYYDAYGQPTSEFTEVNGVPSNNPTNYQAIEKKAHFDDDTWITNQTIQLQTSGGTPYWDCYGVALTPL